ncbi:ATP-binding protein [Actinophytocola sp. NPDC049390]|uniref:ATP-binding protein n=1 Tax=Actinophytocola sp. NPDC049390 TaxID=3363894 RepID=UPI0037B85BF8
MLLHSPTLVGRDDVLMALHRDLAAAADGGGRTVFVTGPSGIGKTRLVNAVADAAFTGGMTLMRGRASTLDPLMPFRPLAEALLSMLRVTPLDPADLGPYGPILGRLVPDWSVPGASREDDLLVVLAEGVVRVTRLAAGQRGCLVVIDDLQNADSETLAVLEYLIDNIGQQPTMILGALLDQDCAAMTMARSAVRRGRATLLALDPLTRGDLEGLIANCLGAPPGKVAAEAVEVVLAGSGGNPCLAEEIVADLVDHKVLVETAGQWLLTEAVPAGAGTDLAHPIGGRFVKLSEQARAVLSVAAAFGMRFPLPVVQQVIGANDQHLLRLLQTEAIAHFVRPDEQSADWYRFRHQLTWQAVTGQLPDDERAGLARVVAGTVETLYPGLDGEWCQIAATLWLAAGEGGRAGELLTELGRRTLTIGAAKPAVALLEQAWQLLADSSVERRAQTLDVLILALVEAGYVRRAIAAVAELDRLASVPARRRAVIHTKAAWAAMIAGYTDDGLTHVASARRLLGDDPDAVQLAEVDIVAAHLALDLPGGGQLAIAEDLARNAARIADRMDLPEIACQAWQLLGAVTRPRDPAEATACLERALSIASRRGLPIAEMHTLIRLGNDDALRAGEITRLELARERASEVGAVTAQCQAEASIALHLVLRGEFDDAAALVSRVLDTTITMQLVEITQYVLLLRAVLGAHRGSRAELDDALSEFEQHKGDAVLHAPRVHGLAKVFCALLEERRDVAVQEMAAAEAAHIPSSTVFHLSGTYGMRPLLRALAGDLTVGELTELMANPASALRWDRQFATFAKAVLLGRLGRGAEAVAEVDEALREGQPYPMGRHLGLRLVGEAALDDDWGEPVPWLRAAEAYFRRIEVPPVVGACRRLLRRAGVRVLQNRDGAEQIPPDLRLRGVTAREYEVLRLLADRLGNREIAEQLHLSTRTVERHVSNLISKTNLPNRGALRDFVMTKLHRLRQG